MKDTRRASPAPNAPAAPEESPPTPNRALRLVLWLVVVALAIIFLPLTLVGNTVRGGSQTMGTQLADIKATLAGPSEPSTEEQALKSTLTVLESEIKGFATAQANLYASYVNWPVVVQAIGQHDMNTLIPMGLTQVENRVLLTGRAQGERTVTDYAQQLRSSEQFARVVVQSIIVRTATGTGQVRPTVADEQGRYVEFAILLELKAVTP